MKLNKFIPAFKSEFLKLNLLSIPLHVTIISFTVVFASFLFYAAVTSLFSDTVYNIDKHSTLMSIHEFYTKYVFLFVIAVIVCTKYGKEYEWRTIHQFFIRGLTSSTMVFTKYAAFVLAFIIEYTKITLAAILVFMVFSPETFAETWVLIDWFSIFSIPAGIFLSVSLALMAVSISFGSTSGVLISIGYFILIEGVLRGALSLVQKLSEQAVYGTIAANFPFTLYWGMNSDNIAYNLTAVIVYSAAFTGLTLALLFKKEMALVKT